MTKENQNQSSSSNKDENQDKALEVWKAKNNRLAEIDIQKTMVELGAIPNQDGDPKKWKIIGVGNIIEMGNNVWFNGNLHTSGRGSVSLVRHAMDLDKDTPAMNWLAEKFPDELKGDWTITQTRKQDEFVEKAFTPPIRVDEGLPSVISYLTHDRGIPKDLVIREIQSGHIYATQKEDAKTGRLYGDYQCVFIGPSSAEIRSVLPDGFKGCCTGSDSEKSGYRVMFNPPHEKVVVQTEAAIDALSYNAIYPSRFTISTNGAGRFELQYKLTLEAFRNGFASIWAYDADTPGDVAAQRQFNSLFLRDKLSEELDVSKEQIDKWILEQKIINHPIHSPHELFLVDMDETNRKVFELYVDKSAESPTSEMVDTNKTAPATITYKIPRKSGKLIRGEYTFELTPDEIKATLKKYNAFHHRPKSAKDWNEICKKNAKKVDDNYKKVTGVAPQTSKETNNTEDNVKKPSPSQKSTASPPPTVSSTKNQLKEDRSPPAPQRGTRAKSRFARKVRLPSAEEEGEKSKMGFTPSRPSKVNRFKAR